MTRPPPRSPLFPSPPLSRSRGLGVPAHEPHVGDAPEPLARMRQEVGRQIEPHDRRPGRGHLLQEHRRATPELERDRKSTRLNSSHLVISYAVFCLKKKKIYH